MKKTVGKLLPLFLILLLAAALAVSGVIAALIDSTTELENKFEPVRFSALVKDQYAVTNSGTAPCLARVKLIANWVDEDGNVLAEAPENASYSWVAGEGWTHLGDSKDPTDGYWYYNWPIAASYASTPVLTDLHAQGGTLELKLLAETVQAAPAEAAASLWREASYHNGIWKEN